MRAAILKNIDHVHPVAETVSSMRSGWGEFVSGGNDLDVSATVVANHNDNMLAFAPDDNNPRFRGRRPRCSSVRKLSSQRWPAWKNLAQLRQRRLKQLQPRYPATPRSFMVTMKI